MHFYSLLLYLVGVLWTSQVSAQMFATIEECDAIYGKPLESSEKTSDVRFYKKDDLTIKILFVENKAAVLTFTKAKAEKLASDAQVKILAGNSSSNRWEEVVGEGPKTWRRSDGLAFAIYDDESGELSVFSADYIENAKSEVQPATNRK